MKKQISILRYAVLSFLLFATNALWAQNAIPTGTFENWGKDTVFNVEGFVNSNIQAAAEMGQPNVLRTTEARSGPFAVKLMTLMNSNDTLPASFLLGDFEEGGGRPFSGSADSLVGYYKGTIHSGDTALVAAAFHLPGTDSAATFVFPLTDSQSTYTRFAFDIPQLGFVPDSFTIGMASSQVDEGVEDSFRANVVYFDDMEIKGANNAQFSFNTWQETRYDAAPGWTSFNSVTAHAGITTARRSTDAHQGDFAMELTSEAIPVFEDTLTGFAMTGRLDFQNPDPDGDPSITGGRPYTQTQDTLRGWYKYTSASNDTALVGLFLQRLGSTDTLGQILPPTGQFQEFKLAVDVQQAPEKAIIIFWAGDPDKTPNPGNRLLIDNLQFDSEGLITGLQAANKASEARVFPNPAREFITLQWPTQVRGTLQVVDLQGRTIARRAVQGRQLRLPVSAWSPGLYFYQLQTDQGLQRGRFSVE